MIINLVHEVWNILFTWEEGALKVPIYHLANNTRVETTGAAPFNNNLAPTESIDMALSAWIASVTRRFPSDHLQQINAFSDIIPAHWDHIFAREGTHNPTQAGRLIDHTPTSRHGGDPDNPQSRSYMGSLLEKVPGHGDSTRGRNRQCVSAIRPFPTFQPSPNGESLEICFGACCKGMKCLQRDCNAYHLDARGRLRNASRASTAAIRTWLNKPAVRLRIRLTEEAAALPCFRTGGN